MSGPSAKDLAAVTDPLRAKAAGAIRRMTASITRALESWQVSGVRLLSGSTEAFLAEIFAGAIGIMARPAASNPEVVTVMVGGGKVPIIVAARDLRTLKAVVQAVTGRGYLQPGETIVHTQVDGACIYLKPNGTIEARTTGGTALALATKADVEALRTYVVNQFSSASGHTHATPSGVTTAITTVASPGTAPNVVPSAVVGTSKLKGE